MRFSNMKNALLHKYHNHPAPAEINKPKLIDKIFFTAVPVLLITAIIFNLLFIKGVLTSGLANNTTSTPTMAPWPTQPLYTSDPASVIMDKSNDVKTLKISEKRINLPSVYGFELLFSAGDGTLDKSVLTNLYLFNAQTEQMTKVASSKLEDGEIYETYLSSEWIVWLDTDRRGTNVIYKMNRKELTGMPVGTISEVQRTENHMPKLGLYGNYLIWMEQVSDEQDELYFVDLTSDENLALQLFTDTNYAISSPYIYKNTVVWAGLDETQNEEDRKINEHSAIYYVVFKYLQSATNEESDSTDGGDSDGEIKPIVFTPGTYVHEPMCNDDVFVWIDKNKAPDSNLYFARKDGSSKVTLLKKNVTSYSIGRNFIVYAYNQVIYAYFYDTDTTVQVSQTSCPSILPQTYGSLVVWEDKTPNVENDVMKYNILE